ncbi:SUMF1/EgtB/PvdO family nonheme iron enzyme [Verrucomicrobiota bacterium]
MKYTWMLSLIISSAVMAAPEVVCIPGGTFEMGDHHDLGGREHRNDELPIRTVTVNPFYMGKYEVTLEEFCEFLNSGDVDVRDGFVWLGTQLLCDTRDSCPYSRIEFDGKQFSVLNGKERHPATGIRWEGAAAYCDWLSKATGETYRLPSEEEWEYAGRGGLYYPYAVFPWGDDDNTARANWPHSGDPYESGDEPFTTSVGFYDGALKDGYQTLNGVNGFGLHDMAGNVWEWCNDLYSQSSADPELAKLMPDGKEYHVLRSGNWFNGEWGYSRVSNRNPGYFRGPQDPDHPYYHIGLRVVREVKGDVPLISGELEILGDEFEFTEGPAADANGKLYFSDLRTERIYSFSTGGNIEVFRENSGGANGLFFDAAGNLIACEGLNGRVTLNGDEILADGFNKPNDLWVDLKGGVYFTDPMYGRAEKIRDGEHVYYIKPDRSEIVRVIDDFIRPNGLIGTPDGKTLYVADAGDQKIWKYTISPDGSLSGKTLFTEIRCDGMTLDATGNLYTTPGPVEVYSPSGELIETIEVPARATNVAFGGVDRRTLFITARTYLCAIPMNIPGTVRQIAASDGACSPANKSPLKSLQGGERPDRASGRLDRPWLLEHASELDVNNDGAVARVEMLNEAGKAFGLYDQNQDDELTGPELKGKGMARSAMGGFIKLHARELDSDGDGIITRSEMMNETEALFDKSDKNRDGKVNVQDERTSRRRPREGNRFARMDENKDGFVSFDEFVFQEKLKKGRVDEERARRKFMRMDADEDGTLSEEEVTNAPRGKGGRK